jgi:hypothetical protein
MKQSPSLAFVCLLAGTMAGCGDDSKSSSGSTGASGTAPDNGEAGSGADSALGGTSGTGGAHSGGTTSAVDTSGAAGQSQSDSGPGGSSASTGGASPTGATTGSGGASPTAGASSNGGTQGPGTTGGANGETGGSSDGSGVWRPYDDTSPWNTPIPSDAALDPDSAALIADFESSSEYGEHLDVNIAGYSVPLYWADSSTPRHTITCRVGGHGFVGDNGMDATAEIPIPDDAAPDPESDHHLLIIDRSTNTEYGLWDAQEADGVWTCGLGALQDLSGEGVRPLAEVADPWWEAHGPRACGYGLSAGLIRPEELEAGVIEHALIVAYPHVRAGMYVSPASTAQAANGAGAQSDRGIPCGGRIQYDPSIDVESIDTSDAGKAILRALQVYGAYVGDYSGAISLYADNSPDAQSYYDSIGFGTYELRDAIDLADFRVIEIGPMYDNGNG